MFRFFVSRWSGYDKVQKVLKLNLDPQAFIERSADEFGVRALFQSPIGGPVSSTVFVCNHPTGALDFLSTYPTLVKAAPNLKVVMNNQLLRLPPLAAIAVGVHSVSANRGNDSAKKAIFEHLKNGGNILVFPAGKVGYLSNGETQDFPWRLGLAEIIKRAEVVVPVYVDAQNDRLFYLIRKYFPRLSMLFLLKSLKKNGSRPVNVRVGSPVRTDTFKDLSSECLVNAVKNLTYSLKNSRGVAYVSD